MNTRKRMLPAGWYPATADEVIRQCKEWDSIYDIEGSYNAAVVPHAGWYFSGKLAYAGIKAIRGECDAVIILGGHMHAGSPVVGYSGGEVETPLGNLRVDSGLFNQMAEHIQVEEDTAPDNTIEVQLPFVKYIFGDTPILAFRTPPDRNAIRFAEVLRDVSNAGNKTVKLIGSTDLTHYGPSYHFTPKGTGKQALDWVKNENDKKMVDALIKLQTEKVLEHGSGDRAACSSGAAASAVEYSKLNGVEEGRLIDYYTSAEMNPGSSFVGYAGIVY